MKNLKDYINEGFKLGKNKASEYKYFPKDKNELKDILRERLLSDPNADLNDIDVSNVTDMSYLFFQLDPHNIDISEWDVSNVENMNSMFNGCVNFNCDISNWDVSKVEDMNYMFFGCKKFKCKGLEYFSFNAVSFCFSFHF